MAKTTLNKSVATQDFQFPDNTLVGSEFVSRIKRYPTYLYRVPQEYHQRPDLVAEQLYHDSTLFWAILIVSGLTIEQFNYKTVISYLSFNDLQEVMMS
jgi:hypothetical protein